MVERASWTKPLVVRISFFLHAVGLLVIAFIVVASAAGWSDLYRWTAEPIKLDAAQPYDGLLSSLGILVWASASAICFFTALTWPNDGHEGESRLILSGGLVTLVLLLDDLFMGHEEIIPRLFGVSELAGTVCIAAFPLAFLFLFRRKLRAAPWGLLAIGVGYLVVMSGFDAVEHGISIPGHHAWEEGAKFLGLLHWCGFLMMLCWLRAQQVPSLGRGEVGVA